MFIGLMLVNEENDILADTLAAHSEIVDCFYVLDGTKPNHYSARVLADADKCAWYGVDDGPARDGMRGRLYDRAVRDHGWDHWFLLLHADEVWTFHPAEVVDAHPTADGFMFRLPFYVPRAEWNPDESPLEQLRWHFTPGWPEFRMFRGGPRVRYDADQHFNVRPHGLKNIQATERIIRHYPYRSPEQQKARAEATFDPDNYRHAAAGRYLWDDEMVADAICQHHTALVH